jgi:hypothetical protein
MKRVLASALIVGVASLFGLSGCGEETKTETKETATTPTGSTTETKTDKVESSGSNPPAAPSGAPAPSDAAPKAP